MPITFNAIEPGDMLGAADLITPPEPREEGEVQPIDVEPEQVREAAEWQTAGASVGRWWDRVTAEEVDGYEVDLQTLNPEWYPYMDDVLDMQSPEEWALYQRDAKAGIRNGAIIQNATLGETANAVVKAEISDPFNWAMMLIPYGAALRAGNYVSAFGRAAAIAGTEGAIYETAFQHGDPTRGFGEGAFQITGSAVLGGTLSTLGRKVTEKIAPSLVKRANKIAAHDQEAAVTIDQGIRNGQQGVGAELVTPEFTTTLADEKTLPDPSKKFTFSVPSKRLEYNKTTPVASRFAESLGLSLKVKNKHLKGIASESSIPLDAEGLRNAAIASHLRDLKEAQSALRKQGHFYRKSTLAEMVTDAAARGKHDIPEVMKAARNLRETLDEWTPRAIEQGLIKSEDILPNYVPHVWRRKKMQEKGHSKNWHNLMVRYADRMFDDLEPGEADYIAASITQHIQGLRPDEATLGAIKVASKDIPKGGVFKDRVIHMNHDEIREYLQLDSRYLMSHYMRTTPQDVLMRETWGVDNVGNIDGIPVNQKWLDEAAQDYEKKLIKLAKAGKSTKKLNEEEEEFLADVLHMSAQAFGYETPQKYRTKIDDVVGPAARNSRRLAASTMLGFLPFSSLPDVANIIGRHGVMSFLKTLPDTIAFGQLNKRARQDFHSFGIGLQRALNTRIRRIADVEDSAFIEGHRSRAMETLMDVGSNVSLGRHWNNIAEHATGTAAQDAIIRDAFKGWDKLGESRRLTLLTAGIDEKFLGRISRHVKAQDSHKAGFVNYADTNKWDSPQDAVRFGKILHREVQATIVRPQVGDLMRILDNEVGKTIALFKRTVMGMARTQHGPMSQRLIRGDLAAANWFVATSAAGMLGYYLRLQAYHGFDQASVDKEIEDMDPVDWLYEGVDRGAAMGFMTEGFNILDHYSNGKLVGKLNDSGIPLDQSSRYYWRGVDWGSISPVTSLADKAATVARDLGGEAGIVEGAQMSKSTIHAIRGLTPGQNAWWLYYQLGEFEKEVTKGMPQGKKRAKRRKAKPAKG